MATGANNNAVTLSSADAFFKQWYLGGGGLNRLMYESDPFLGRLKRLPATTMVGGDEIVVPIRAGRNPNVTKKFANAQSGAKTTTGERKKWILTVDDLYGVIRVSDKAILASKNDRGAFVRLLKDEADDVLARMSERRCVELFAAKANLMATVRSRTGSTVTFQAAHEASRFEIGDSIEFRTTAGAERAGNPYSVTKVDRSGNVLTLNKAVNAAVAANDECYIVGSYGEASMTSLEQWIPRTITGLGTLNNIDRSIDPLRLAGHRLQMTASGRFDDSIRKVCAQINQLTGTNPTVALTNPLVEDLIAVEQRANVRYDQASGKGANQMIGAGIGGLAINTAKGPVEVLTSSWAPVDTVWLLNEADLALYYLADEGSDFVFFKKNPESGSMFKLAHDSAGIEARVESFGNFAMQSPGRHGRVLLHSSKIPSFA